MPIYEFYCRDCHTIFSFFSPRIDTEAAPACPRCATPEMSRRPSRFATLKHRDTEDGEHDPLDALDDARLEGAMETLMREVGDLGEGEEDPRAMGRLMRRFSELTGLELGDQMEDYVARLEAGADPESLDQEMEDALGEDDAGLEDFFKVKRTLERRRRRPRVDEKLYFL